MSHAGTPHRGNIAEYVREITFVNALCQVQTVSDPNLLRSASGAFGAFGVIVSMVFRLEKFSYVTLRPRQQSCLTIVPPLDDSYVPMSMMESYRKIGQGEMKKALEVFEKEAIECYNRTIYWFPFEEMGWVNGFYLDGKDSQWSPMERTKWDIGPQLQAEIDKAADEHRWKDTCTVLSNKFQEVRQEVDGIKVVSLPEALQNPWVHPHVPVTDLSIGIPIEFNETTGKFDFTIVRKAFWDMINIAHKHEEEGACNHVVHLRLVGESNNTTLAPHRGNKLTCVLDTHSIVVKNRR